MNKSTDLRMHQGKEKKRKEKTSIRKVRSKTV